jgi:hypothetical protein
LTKGIEEGKQSSAREIAARKATNEALHKRIGEILEQSNGNATGQLVATENLRWQQNILWKTRS